MCKTEISMDLSKFDGTHIEFRSFHFNTKTIKLSKISYFHVKIFK